MSTHRIEDILDGVRDRRIELRPAVIEAMFGGMDTLRLLLDRTVSALEASGLRVLTHSRVPTNDGGISLGQVAVAAAQDRSMRRAGQ